MQSRVPSRCAAPATLAPLTTACLLVWFALAAAALPSGPAAAGSASNHDDDTAATTEPLRLAHLHLSGELVETPAEDPFGLMGGQGVSLLDLMDVLEQARKDPQLDGVILTLGELMFGAAQVEEVHQALVRLREAGKSVRVHAGSLGTWEYAMVAPAGEINLVPEADLWLTGMYAETLYARGLLDMIGLRGDFVAVGDYKSGAEVLTRDRPSTPAAENMNWLLDSMYGSLTEMIADGRGLDADKVHTIVDAGVHRAEAARELGLADSLDFRADYISGLRQRLGHVVIDNRYGEESAPEINFNNPFALFSFFGELQKMARRRPEPSVAVIFVEGMIVTGYGEPDPFGGGVAAWSGDIAAALDEAREDPSVRAVVLRVDSPGGSVEASEIILEATLRVRAEKPLLVSMGNVAASGGYYVSCGADRIFADALTITGSIGVLGGKLINDGLWGHLGLNWVTYQRGANADLFSSERPFTDAQRAWLSNWMQEVYDGFKRRVVEGRGDALTGDIEDLAGGRVYTGAQALELGLVDEIGGLHDALVAAAAEAGLGEDFNVRVMPEPVDFLTALIGSMSGREERPTDIRLSAPLGRLLRDSAGLPDAAAAGLQVLARIEPERARAAQRLLLAVEQLRREHAVMVLPVMLIVR